MQQRIKLPAQFNLMYGHTAPQVKRARQLKPSQSSSNPLRVRGALCIALNKDGVCQELSIKDAPHGWFCEKHSVLERELLSKPKGGVH